MLKIIRFETTPINLSKAKSFFPNSKYKNKLYKICHTYILSKKNSIEFDDEIFLREMNEPAIMRNLGLSQFYKSLEGKKKIETEFIKPAGEIIGKKIKPQYIKVSKKYVLLDVENRNGIDYLKVIEFKRLQAFKDDKRVKIYDIQLDKSYIKFYEVEQ